MTKNPLQKVYFAAGSLMFTLCTYIFQLSSFYEALELSQLVHTSRAVLDDRVYS